MPESEAFAIATNQFKDRSHKTKSADVALWKGFSNELQKIATAKGMTGPISTMGSKKSTLTSTPKLTSKPVMKEPEPTASVLDQIGSTRTIQPPPVTSGVY